MSATHTKPPPAVQRISAILIRLSNLGVPLGSIRLMETGHATFPIDVIRHDGHDWLVSIFGDTRWVKQTRKTGEVRLRRGRRPQTFTAVEVHGPQSIAVVERTRRKARWNPWASAALRADHDHPVFRIELP